MAHTTKLPGNNTYVGTYEVVDSDGYLYQRGVKITKTAAEINGFVAGTPGDGTITDAKLATAVKVGNVATLTTTEKTNVVGAINEVDAHADASTTAVAAINSALGNMATATTTAKTVVGAINELDAENAAFATKTGAETLTNKTLTSPVLSTPKISDGDAGLTVTSADQTNAAAVATIPDIGDAADDFVMKDTAQTLTNKTLTTPKIATTGAIVDAGGDEYLKFVEATTPVTYVQISSGDTTVAPKVQGAGETNTDLHLLGSGTGNVKVSDGTDPTKLAVFELNGATTGKATTFAISHTDNRTITFPDATDTLVGKATTDTLTNKTLTAPLLTDPAQTVTLSAHDYENGATDWTLSAAELLKPYHKPTNANGAVNAIVATTIRPYCFINATGHALTVKTAAGDGPTITSGKTAIVMSDGTNVIALAAESA